PRSPRRKAALLPSTHPSPSPCLRASVVRRALLAYTDARRLTPLRLPPRPPPPRCLDASCLDAFFFSTTAAESTAKGGTTPINPSLAVSVSPRLRGEESSPRLHRRPTPDASTPPSMTTPASTP